MSGKYQRRDENYIQIIVESIKPVENSNIVTISLKKELPFESVMALKDTLVNYRGTDPLVFKTEDENGNTSKVLASANFWLNANNDLVQGLEKQFGQILEVSVNSLE